GVLLGERLEAAVELPGDFQCTIGLEALLDAPRREREAVLVIAVRERLAELEAPQLDLVRDAVGEAEVLDTIARVLDRRGAGESFLARRGIELDETHRRRRPARECVPVFVA